MGFWGFGVLGFWGFGAVGLGGLDPIDVKVDDDDDELELLS